VSTPTDKEIAWQGRIQERAARATAAIMTRLERYPKSGLASLAPADRRDVAETVAKEVIDTILTMGTFVAAGAQDFQIAGLTKVTITGADKVKLELVPAIADGKAVNLDLLAQNSGKQVVIAFINGVAYEGAREALSKAIHREQTDWINRERDREAVEAEQQPAGGYPEGGNIVEGTATATVATISARAEGDLIADQPGDNNAEIEERATEGAEAEAQASGGDSGGHSHTDAAGADRIADDAGAGAQGPDSSGDVPPEPPAPPARKKRAGRAGWPGHH
jgi:hypothetical protein